MTEANILIDNLNRLGVHFLVGDGHSGLVDILEPAALISGLVSQSDSRIRLALIAVLLQRPDFANDAHKALDLLDEPQKLNFKLYYTAAHYLQVAYANQLLDLLGPYHMLPDYYSEELNIEKNKSVKNQLMQLAERHKEITSLPLNWYGTYNFAAQRVITRLNKERAWATV
ncbi:MAG: hypothetical protein MUO67_01810 [Anaerolineales bacterium]|jgi:hypothetical protein|nr:hypothetical protein [Anaerolineales bacterium]